MNINKILLILTISISSLVALALAEETTTTLAPIAQAADLAIAPAVRSDTQWVWGEVTSVDSQAKSLTLKYLDYEADQEKNIVLSVDDNTAYENINSIDELKEKDVLSVDYLIVDGQNIAKNISLEKVDAVIPEAASATTSSVESAQNAAVSTDNQSVTQVTEASVEVSAKEPVAQAAVAEVSADAEQPAQDPAVAVGDTLATANPADK